MNEAESTPPQITLEAIQGNPQHRGLLGSEAYKLWTHINTTPNALHIASTQARKREELGCLAKLSVVLLQCSRIKDYHDWLIRQARESVFDHAPENQLQNCMALMGEDACADFEGLLLQARAALDRLSSYIALRFKNKTTHYSSLCKILGEFSHKSTEATNLLAIYDHSQSWIDRLLVDVGTEKSFRSLVAHHMAARERSQTWFAINLLDKHRALILDCEIHGFGVVQTAHEASQHLAFIVLNSLAVTNNIQSLPFSAFAPTWKNRCVRYHSYILKEPPDTPLGVNRLSVIARGTPWDVTLSHHNVDPKIYELAVSFAPTE